MTFDALASGWAKSLGVDRKQFNMFFDRMMDGFAYQKIVIDKDGKPIDYVFLEVNKAFEELTGLKKEKIIGKKVTEVLKGIENDPADWIGVYGRVALTGEPTHFENYAKSLGKWYRVSAYCPEKGYFVALFEDITEQKESEEALRASEERFFKAFQASPEAMAIQTASGSRFVFVNESFTRLFEFSVDEVVGHTTVELNMNVEPEKRAQIISKLVKEGSVKHFENAFRTKSGKIVPLYVSSETVVLNGEKHYLSVLTDISELKKVEEALRNSEQRWATTLASIGDAVIATDVLGNVTFVNRVAEELTGWTAAEASHKPLAKVFNIINGSTRKQLEDPVEKVLATDKVVGLANHTVLVRKDGSEVPIDDSGAPIKDASGKVNGAVLIFRDITARRSMEKELFNLAKFPSENPDPVLRVSQNGIIIYANPPAQKLSELIKTRLGELAPIKWRQCISEAFSSNSKVCFEETVGDRDFIFNVTPILSGSYANIYGSDITERKQAEDAMRYSNERLSLYSLIASQLLSTAKPQAFIQDIGEKVMVFLNCDVFFNFLLDEEKEKLHLNAFAGVTPSVASNFEWLSFGEAVCGCAAKEGRRIVCENIPDTQDVRTALVRSLGVKAYAAHPIFSEGKVIGTISFGSKKKSTFNEDELGFMKTVTAQISVAMERMRAEQALNKSLDREHFLAELVRNASLAVGVGYPDGTLGLVNEAFQELTGYSEEELRTTSWNTMLTPPEYWDFERAQLERVNVTKKPVRYEKEYIRKDGSRVPIELSVHPFFDEKGNVTHYYSFITDISERKAAEQDLIKQAALIDLSPDGVLVKKLDNTITFWSEGAEKLYGWSKQEAIGQKACYLLRTEYPTSSLEKILEEVQEIGNWSGELHQIGRDGQQIIVRSSWLAMPTGHGDIEILQSNIDLTAEKRLQFKLEEKAAEVEEYATRMEELVEERTHSVKRQAALIDLSPDAIIARDLNGTVTFWSVGAEKLYGWTAKEAIGQIGHNLLKTVFPAPLNTINLHIERTGSWSGELIHKTRNGREVIVESRWLAEKDSSGRIRGVLETNLDITERKKAEQSALESARKLKDAERLATIGATAGMVGHDIRNPLQAIISELFLAKSELDGVPNDDARRNLAESIANIENDVDYINKIVQDLQDFAKPLKPVAKITNIQEIIDEIMTKNHLPDNIEVSQRISTEATQFVSDPDLLRRIVANLISNAVQAMPKGGRLSVSAHVKAGELTLSVEDTGVGISDEVKAKLFTPLFTTKSKGQGFGLPVIKRMTEALGGNVTFESEVGKGTKFTVRLPKKN